jgi:hypothetical protein
MNIFASYSPSTVLWQLYKGGSELITLQIVEDDGTTGIDLTNYTFLMELTSGPTGSVIKSWATGEVVNSITGDEEGNLVIGKPANFCKLPKGSQYYATLFAINAGEKYPLAVGKLEVL